MGWRRAPSNIGRMALITSTDVATALGVTLTTPQQDAVTQGITHLIGRLEKYLRRPITSATRTETASQAELAWSTRWFLKYTPVTAVASVTIGDDTLTNGSDYDWYPWGLTGFYTIASSTDVVTVTYTGGLDGANDVGINSVLLEAAKRLAVRVIDQTQTVESLNTEGYHVAYTHEDGAFSDQELKLLEHHKRRYIGGRFTDHSHAGLFL